MKGKSMECGRISREPASVLASNSVDLVLTSPPYLTAQKYIRTNRLELFCLGYNESDLNSLERSSIGTEHVSAKTRILPLGVETIDEQVESIRTDSNERAIQVFQYFKDMMDALKEIHRVLRKNSYATIVVGDNTVVHKSIETYRLLTDAAVEIGFEEMVILKDTIRSRSMLTKRNGTGGIIKNEYAIILKKVS
jgi:DNA modification methylase